MYGTFLPQPTHANIWTFKGPGPGNFSNLWQIWKKPRGAKFVWMQAIGAGGGGGGGSAGATATVRGGGGSGGCGATQKLLVPADLLPDILYISPGMAGSGGASATAGVGGNASVISIVGANTVNNQNIILSAGGGSQGGAGTTVGGSAGGAGTSTTTNCVFQSIGIFTGTNGTAGAAGSVTATAPTAIAWGTN